MSDTPKISAIFVNWNRCALLQAAVSSLWMQKYPDLEVIVIDNGSTDGSLEWLRQQNEIILIENGGNRGASAARNQGIRMATGTYVLFMDSDAELLTDGALQRLAQVMESQPEIAGNSGGIYSDRDTSTIWCYSPCTDWEGIFDPQRSTTLQELPPALSTCFSLFRADIVRDVGGFDEFYFYLFEDGDLCERIRKAGYRFFIDPEVKILHHYAEPGRTKRDEIAFHYYHEKLRMYYLLKNWGFRSFLPSAFQKIVHITKFKNNFPYLPLFCYIDIYVFRTILLLFKYPYVRLLRSKKWI
jgi:GT2 family glycosyltransferase